MVLCRVQHLMILAHGLQGTINGLMRLAILGEVSKYQTHLWGHTFLSGEALRHPIVLPLQTELYLPGLLHVPIVTLYSKFYWGTHLGLEAGVMGTTTAVPDIKIIDPQTLLGPWCYDFPVQNSFIQVTSPQANASWGLGTDVHEITWTHFGNLGSLVRITLHNGINGQFIREISHGVPIQDQAYVWEIDHDLAEGRYTIRATVLVTETVYGQSPSFDLVSPSDDLETQVYFSPAATTFDRTLHFGRNLLELDSGASLDLNDTHTFCGVRLPFVGSTQDGTA